MDYLTSMNKLLTSIRVRKVSSLDSEHPDAKDARDELQAQLTSVLKRGWWFNRVYNVECQPDPQTGHIQFGKDVLAVTLSDYRDKRAYSMLTLRDTLLFDTVRNTYVFPAPLYMTVVYNLSWDELPEAAQEYIMYKAAKEYVSDKIADQIKVRECKDSETEAFAELNAQEIVSQGLNMFDNPRIAAARAGRRPFNTQRGRYF